MRDPLEVQGLKSFPVMQKLPSIAKATSQPSGLETATRPLLKERRTRQRQPSETDKRSELDPSQRPCGRFRRATTGIKQCQREQKQVHGPARTWIGPVDAGGQDKVLSLLREQLDADGSGPLSRLPPTSQCHQTLRQENSHPSFLCTTVIGTCIKLPPGV